MEVLKVSSKTDVRRLGRALYHALKENGGEAVLQAMGAGAISQAVKGVAVARGLAAPEGADLKVVPGLTRVTVDGAERKAMQLRVFWR
ncbi:stage V sporulation protein S [Thermanaeromonas toyohensis ToBE]|uniref:Stage V sporulation protein S n=1 Tax=Thermanaeromonas toyohensis ToBE TaxID=698762 RepID=A0A1W1VTX1_9FIRM|nr:stage V sporulation protein S [Thermanaeromonas toyohensis]SMB96680.1 stage V sporulation protein S [Thermanaeromonas toyohensis ToBE]